MFDDLVERESPPLEVLFRREAHLRVDDAVVGEIEDAFPGDAFEPLGGLHDRDGVLERLEVALERSAVRRLPEPAGQAGLGVLREGVTALVGEVEDRRRTQATVEVVVEQNLRRGAYLRGSQLVHAPRR